MYYFNILLKLVIYTFSSRDEFAASAGTNYLKSYIKFPFHCREKLDEYGVCIRCFGDITLLPVDLQKLVAETILYTYNNTK